MVMEIVIKNTRLQERPDALTTTVAEKTIWVRVGEELGRYTEEEMSWWMAGLKAEGGDELMAGV